MDLVPFDWVLYAIGIIIILMFYIVYSWIDYRTNAPEAKIFAKARRKGLPVLSLENISDGRAEYVLGTKDDNDDPIFEIQSMKVDPSLCSGDATPARYIRGLNIWHYASSKALPMPLLTALSISTIKRHRNDSDTFAASGFLTDIELMTLLKSARQDLEHDCKIFIDKYSPIWNDEHETPLKVKELVDIIKNMQDYFSALPMETGFFSYFHAFKSNPYAHSSQDIQRIKYLFEQKLWEKLQKQMKIWMYILMAIALMGATAVVIYVISMAMD